MPNNLIAAFGHNENVYVFSSVGIFAKIVNEENLESRINDYLERGVKIFFISQKFATQINNIRTLYKNDPYPMFILLAMDKNEESIGSEEIRKNVEQATGIRLF